MLKFLAKLSRSIKGGFVREPPPSPLPHPDFRSDLEYEKLFKELLKKVEQGESWGQLQGFLIANQLDEKRLAQWLQGYGDRWLAQPMQNQELARRLVKLAQVATGELGTVARTLGERLLVSSYGDSRVLNKPHPSAYLPKKTRPRPGWVFPVVTTDLGRAIAIVPLLKLIEYSSAEVFKQLNSLPSQPVSLD